MSIVIRLITGIVVLLLLDSLAACSTKSSRTSDDDAAILTNRIAVDGLEREYQFTVPEQANNIPLVILLHGNGGSPEVMTGANGRSAPHKVWLALATQHQFAVAIPRGLEGLNGSAGWNDCRNDATSNPMADDVAFISRLIDQMAANYPIDLNRVYLAGTSNGGMMAMRLGIELRNKITAIAPIVAAMPVNSECTNPAPIPILFMNGTDDPILPFAGGTIGRPRDNRGVVYSLTDSVWRWIDANGGLVASTSENLPDINTRDNSTVSREVFSTNSNNDVVVYTVAGGGHTEPSIAEQYTNVYEVIVGEQNHDIEMAEVIWAFFQDKVR